MNFLLGADGSIKVADLELSREVVVQDADDDGTTSIPDGDGAQTVVQHVATGSALSGYHIPDTVNVSELMPYVARLCLCACCAWCMY